MEYKQLGFIFVTGHGERAHFIHCFKIDLLVFNGSVDLRVLAHSNARTAAIKEKPQKCSLMQPLNARGKVTADQLVGAI